MVLALSYKGLCWHGSAIFIRLFMRRARATTGSELAAVCAPSRWHRGWIKGWSSVQAAKATPRALVATHQQMGWESSFNLWQITRHSVEWAHYYYYNHHHHHNARTRSHRLVVLERCLELAQRHVGGGAAIIAFNVVLVYLQGLGGISQGIAIALCAQVCQAAVAVVDGIGRVELQGLRVVLDRIFVVFRWKRKGVHGHWKTLQLLISGYPAYNVFTGQEKLKNCLIQYKQMTWIDYSRYKIYKSDRKCLESMKIIRKNLG